MSQAELDKALPLLEQAVECLNELDKKDIDEIKNFKSPPYPVVLTMEAACIMLKPIMKFKIIKKPDNAGRLQKSYWDTAKKYVLNNPKKLLEILQDYDRDNIPNKLIIQIEPYLKREEFQVEVVEYSSIC